MSDGLSSLITVDDYGLRCEAGGFWIDPWRPVPRAVITHAHADHARPGSEHHICSRPTEPFLRHRLGTSISATTVDWEEPTQLGECTVSLHPAGHVSGSAQVRIERAGEVWVFTGDYKREADPSCETFCPVRCDTLITEATFGLPVYAWRPGKAVAREIFDWWRNAPDRPSMLFCYAFGKTQRVLAELAQLPEARELADERGVYLHGAATRLTELYEEQGYRLLPTRHAGTGAGKKSQVDVDYTGSLIIAPPSAHRSAWMKRFTLPQTAFVSGWMQVRGIRRRRGYERGFVLSDHADWNGLIQTVRESQAGHVYVTHGQSQALSTYLAEELGVAAEPLDTLYEREADAS